jgi:hypothetical protein
LALYEVADADLAVFIVSPAVEIASEGDGTAVVLADIELPVAL